MPRSRNTQTLGTYLKLSIYNIFKQKEPQIHTYLYIYVLLSTMPHASSYNVVFLKLSQPKEATTCKARSFTHTAMLDSLRSLHKHYNSDQHKRQRKKYSLFESNITKCILNPMRPQFQHCGNKNCFFLNLFHVSRASYQDGFQPFCTPDPNSNFKVI